MIGLGIADNWKDGLLAFIGTMVLQVEVLSANLRELEKELENVQNRLNELVDDNQGE